MKDMNLNYQIFDIYSKTQVHFSGANIRINIEYKRSGYESFISIISRTRCFRADRQDQENNARELAYISLNEKEFMGQVFVISRDEKLETFDNIESFLKAIGIT